jgi:ATF/CREB family transcription factor
MLTGPAGSNAGDYFDSINRGFPTPNESGLRTGLTPGGGGSMFPAPSPGSSALFHQMQSGTATPGTIDFHRTAMNAAARSKNNTSYAPTSAAHDPNALQNGMEAHHDATDAANGLFMLAKGGQGNNQFNPPPQPQQPVQNNGMQNGKRSTRNNGSLGNMPAPDMSANGESPESEEQNSRPATRGGRGKKTAKAEAAANNRRKAEPASKNANKRAKGNSGAANVDPNLEPGDEDDEEMMDSGDDGPQDKKGQTDEEKRRNFLERNRYVVLLQYLNVLLMKLQSCRSQMSTTQEAMAC